MRIISQDGKRDFNYENIDLEIFEHPSGKTLIFCNTMAFTGIKLAQYSSKEKAEKAMNQLHMYCINECLIWQFPREDEIYECDFPGRIRGF